MWHKVIISLSWILTASVGYSDIFPQIFIVLTFQTSIFLLCTYITWKFFSPLSGHVSRFFLETGTKCSWGTKMCLTGFLLNIAGCARCLQERNRWKGCQPLLFPLLWTDGNTVDRKRGWKPAWKPALFQGASLGPSGKCRLWTQQCAGSVLVPGVTLSNAVMGRE